MVARLLRSRRGTLSSFALISCRASEIFKGQRPEARSLMAEQLQEGLVQSVHAVCK